MTSAAGLLDEADDARREWLGLMAQAAPGRLVALTESVAAPFGWLRRPEIGTVMVRGRTGGTGAPFNLGEITVTRASLQLDGGPVGHGYVQGRDKKAAERAALIDALMQTEQAEAVRAQVIAPLAVEAAEAKRSRAAKAAATKVEFFTLVRGEDQ
jgi:alpha-D-ribose 1-methylphosphonate 5-triphosphate synthase subunit PhnG